MIDGREVCTSHCSFWCFLRKAEYNCVCWFRNIRFVRDTLVDEELGDWVFPISAYSSNIVTRMPRMKATSAVHQLGDCARRFNTSDSDRRSYPKQFSVFFIRSNCHLFQSV